MSDLRSRAQAYLSGPCIISEPEASMTRLIERYAASEPWNDPELRSLLSLCLQTAQTEAARLEGATAGPARDAHRFYQRAAALLQDIQSEVSAGRV
jgi:hypothetical protein